MLFNHQTNDFTVFIAVGTDWRVENPQFSHNDNWVFCYSIGQYDNASFIRVFQHKNHQSKTSYLEYAKINLTGIISSVFWANDSLIIVELVDQEFTEKRSYYKCDIQANVN